MSLLKKWGTQSQPLSPESSKSSKSVSGTSFEDIEDIERSSPSQTQNQKDDLSGEHPRDLYLRLCGRYFEGCSECADHDRSSVFFCRKLRTSNGGWLQ